MESKTCRDCRYFHQHYVWLQDGWYMAAACGHCSQNRLKHRRPYKPACEAFEENIPREKPPKRCVDAK